MSDNQIWTEFAAALSPILLSLISVLVAFLIRFINIKADELKAKATNETDKKYIEMISNTITNCVIQTNQVYVDSLKNKNIFDADAQKTAFDTCLKNVETLLSDECKVYIQETYNDLEGYLTMKIEAEVKKQKSKENVVAVQNIQTAAPASSTDTPTA